MIVLHEPHQPSTTTTPLGFQGQGGSRSNYQGQRRPASFEENISYLQNDMKKSSENILSNLENNQVNIGASFKNLETIQANMGASLKILEI